MALLVLAGCATTSPNRLNPGQAAEWLGGQPRVVVRLDAAQVKAWNELTKSEEALKAVGDRTKTVWLGFDLDHLDDLPRAADTLRVVLEGDFPRGLVGLALDWSGQWKKEPGTAVWTDSRWKFSISLPQENLVAVRRHDPTAAASVPGVLRTLNPVEVEAAAVWVSFWSPGQALFGEPGARLLPIDRLDAVFTVREDRLEGPLRLWFADEQAARAASVLLKLLAPQIRARLGQDLVWTQEGPLVVGQTLSLNQADLQFLALRLLADPGEAASAPSNMGGLP